MTTDLTPRPARNYLAVAGRPLRVLPAGRPRLAATGSETGGVGGAGVVGLAGSLRAISWKRNCPAAAVSHLVRKWCSLATSDTLRLMTR